ncbi:MAG: DNA alkylation repair protein [Candidatus Coproplasma sp.]
MGLYHKLLDELFALSDESYAKFHSTLLHNQSIKVIGVRTPLMRKIAKEYYTLIDELLLFPDEYYEVTFIKFTVASMLPWEKFIKVIDNLVPLIDNWATCDCFKAKCIKARKKEFLPYIQKYLSEDKEFYQRYALVTLLHFYVEEEWLDLIFDSIKTCNCNYYYVSMASAWLIAEVIVKYFGEGVKLLLSAKLDRQTHNKAIQKACESYRLDKEKKEYLKTLKI